MSNIRRALARLLWTTWQPEQGGTLIENGPAWEAAMALGVCPKGAKCLKEKCGLDHRQDSGAWAERKGNDEIEIGQLRTEAARRLLRENQYPSVERLRRVEDQARDLEHETMMRALDHLREIVRIGLTDENEISHGEAVSRSLDGSHLGLGLCAYCNDDWPCPTQQAIDRLLARLAAA